MTPEADLDPNVKLFTRLVTIHPTPSIWPTIGRIVGELTALAALLAAGGVFFAWIALTH